MVSQSAEYSLRAVVCLASRPGESLTIRQIADATYAPAGYLAKVLVLLSRAGLVAAQRGLNGGYSLIKDPRQITLLDIVRVADASRRILSCPLGAGSRCNGTLCALHRQLDKAAAAAEAALADRTIAEILAESVGGWPRCEETTANSSNHRLRSCSK